MAINIMITDDHSMIREGLKNLLELDGDIKVIAEAENGEDCLDKLKTWPVREKDWDFVSCAI